MYARYTENINRLKGSELIEYTLKAAPFLRDYDSTKNKKDLFARYLYEVENEGSGVQCDYLTAYICPVCSSSNIYNDELSSDAVCIDCGAATYVLGTARGFKEEQETDTSKNIYSYKRENHFNEWLMQFQAREATTIPPEVFSALQEEVRKQKLVGTSLTHAKIRECLKKLKMNKYYEHVPYISSIMNGIQPPKMSTELEEQLRNMFYKIQSPFNLHCPADRKNFLSYSYILYKFCELLSEDSYLKCFPLLKSKEKLYKQDVIWRKICADLKWEFIPTSVI